MSCRFIHEPASEYHAKKDKYLTSHQLKDFMLCPLLYYKKKIGQIPDKDTRAFLLGRATHTLILEGQEVFEDSPERELLTKEELDLMYILEGSVRGHREAVKLLSEGVAEGVVRTNYCGVECQIRMDWFNPKLGLVDLKTCKDLTWFKQDSKRYKYSNQLAFYRGIAGKHLRKKIPVWLIAVEKQEPYRCAVYTLTDYVLGTKEEENIQAIERLKECKQLEEWPTGFEDVKSFNWL